MYLSLKRWGRTKSRDVEKEVMKVLMKEMDCGFGGLLPLIGRFKLVLLRLLSLAFRLYGNGKFPMAFKGLPVRNIFHS
jgi:hypothetical protein